MTNTTTTASTSTAMAARPSGQLSFFSADRVPPRFRLDAATVRRGRRHIAEIRKMLAAAAASEVAEPHATIPARHVDPPRAA